MMTTAALLLALITSTPGAEAAGEPVLLDFHSEGCPPCRQMRPAIDQLVQKGYQVKSVDAEESPELFERYQVRDVPTFIVVDPSGRTMARTKGLQPARQLADLYRIAKAKLATDPPAADEPPAGARLTAAGADAEEDAPTEDRPDDEAGAAASSFANPKPWETVVRIKVHDAGAIGLGSGTVIHSTPQESIILTCAHIFKLQGGRQPRQASEFPSKITVDLFDGKLSGPDQAVRKVETVAGEAIDYDFALDVGLIRIRPGRRLPASRVVPASWQPQKRMPMTTVGCSEGHDATKWETIISQPSVRGLVGNPNYEAIECKRAPKQGRSGGGLYTTDGYVAGVCDFAEPRGNHGLYASPRSIHRLLDRNRLTALYAPATGRPGTLLAQGTAPTRGGRRRRPSPAPSRPTATSRPR
jgi:thiol-disulfide isomerase/thioredoxin